MEKVIKCIIVSFIFLFSIITIHPISTGEYRPASQTMILRPNANGLVNEWRPQWNLLDKGIHWYNVNEEVEDAKETTVRGSTNNIEDWYQLQNPYITTGDIIAVTTYSIIAKMGSGTGGIHFLISDGANQTSSSRYNVTQTYTPWNPHIHSHRFDNSPDGDGWTWSDITNLQIGMLTNYTGTMIMHCSQVYAEIEYAGPPLSIYYVGGSGGGNYSTIQDAVDAASNNSFIYIYNGTYDGGITVDKPLIITGQTIENVTIDCDGSNGFSLTGKEITIQSMTINNATNGIYITPLNAIETITNTRITNCTRGIYLYHTSKNSIFGNTFFNNSIAIRLDVTYENTIRENNIENSSSYGIYSDLSDDNNFYFNNFLNNSIQARDDGNNNWDTGEWGNYWSNYNGTDANGDGRGDTPYNITGGSNKDNYPLMNLKTRSTLAPTFVYVDQDFNTSTSGWGYTHYDSIQHGMGVASIAEGTCYVYSGTYQGTINILNPLTLLGQDKNTTIIEAVGDVVVWVSGDRATISQFTIRYSSGGPGEGNPGIYVGGDYCNITYCNIIENRIGIRLESDGNTIHHCLFMDNDYRSIRFDDASNCHIHNCSFYDDTGIYIHYFSSDNFACDNYMENVSFGIHIAYNSDNNYFIRNYVIGNEGNIVDVNQNGDLTSENNNIYHNNFYNGSDPFGYSDWHTTTNANHYNDSTLGNFYDDYKERYPSATNDSIVWDTPLEYDWGNQQDNYPLVDPVNFTGNPPEPPPSGCPWDLNDDGVVNYLDASILVYNYGSSGAPGWIPSDINEDGTVNYLDASILIEHYGESCS